MVSEPSQPTSKNRTRRFVVGLNGASFMGMFQVGNPNGWGGVHAEYVLASDHDAEIERLREENRALRNLANNLRPGPISQALQDSPDYSGQTIERLRAALEKIAEFDCRPYEHVGELKCWSCYANDVLSDDSQSCTCRKLPEPPSDDCPIHGESQVETGDCPDPVDAKHGAVVYGSLTAHDPNNVTRELWTMTDYWRCAKPRRRDNSAQETKTQPDWESEYKKIARVYSREGLEEFIAQHWPGNKLVDASETVGYPTWTCPNCGTMDEFDSYHDTLPNEGDRVVIMIECRACGLKCTDGRSESGSAKETSVSVADYDAIDTTNPQPVPSPRFAGLTGEMRAPKAGDRCGHCGREWMPAPYRGQGVYHECHTGPSQQVKTSDECLAHNSGCHVRDGSGICPLCKQPVGPVEKASYRPVCSKCQTPMRLAQTEYGMGWQLDCACKDGGPAKREPDNVDCGNPVMVNAERYGPCTLPSGHDGDCKRTTKETVPRSDEGQWMPFHKTSPRTLTQPERPSVVSES